MPNESLKRYARVTVHDRSGGLLVDTEGLTRVRFECASSVSGKAGECSLRLYGLTEREEYRALLSGKTASLIAGDAESHGLLFSGAVIDGFDKTEDQDRYIQLSLVDGDGFFQSFASLSLGAGETLGGLVEKCVTKCSSPIGIGHIAKKAYDIRLPRGAAVLGSPWDTVRQTARTLNACAYVYMDRLYLLAETDGLDGEVIPVGQDSGLLGVPVTDHFYASFAHEPWSALAPGRLISLSQDAGGGLFRVAQVSALGDTQDGDWLMNVLAVGVSDAGPNATALTANIWR